MDFVAQEAVRECDKEPKGTWLEQKCLIYYNRKDGHINVSYLGEKSGGMQDSR